MGFAQDSGYTPASIETIMSAIRVNVNTQFNTTYTDETFVGTNFYKFYYALAQRLEQNEIKTSEIFANLQQYFNVTNARIQRPVATTPGVIEALEKAGYIASVKGMIDADAGKISICVDVDSAAAGYAAKKLAINTIIKNSVAAGIVTQGTEVSNIVLSNGQNFDFKYLLPTVVEPLLRLTLTLSDNNKVVVDTPENVKALLLANIAAKYRLGRDFEPQRYFTTANALWTSQVLLEWSTDGGTTWHNEIFQAAFNNLYRIKLANVTLIEA